MIEFYESVFDMKMKEAVNGPYKFYFGKIPGFVTLQFVPKELSGIKFQQNRHQFNFRAKNLDEVIKKALAKGGTQQGEIIRDGKDRIFSVTDPEHNYKLDQNHLTEPVFEVLIQNDSRLFVDHLISEERSQEEVRRYRLSVSISN